VWVCSSSSDGCTLSIFRVTDCVLGGRWSSSDGSQIPSDLLVWPILSFPMRTFSIYLNQSPSYWGWRKCVPSEYQNMVWKPPQDHHFDKENSLFCWLMFENWACFPFCFSVVLIMSLFQPQWTSGCRCFELIGEPWNRQAAAVSPYQAVVQQSCCT